jgi:hypothetical protein
MSPHRPRLEYDGQIGARIPAASFQGFTALRVLARYNHPLLQEMISPRGESWLFNWLESDEDFDAEVPPNREVVHSWVAFRVSQERLSAIETDRVSLRDAILAAEHQLYVLTGPSPLQPAKVRAVPAGKLPLGGLPAERMTIHGKEISARLEPTTESRKLSLEFRLSAESISKGQVPFGISGIFQDRFQRWISAAAHYAFDPSPRAFELTYKDRDWSNVGELATGTGSFTISAVADGKPFELDRLDEALAHLERLVVASRTGPERKESIAKGVGRAGVFALFSLLNFVTSTRVSVEIRWGEGANEKKIYLDPEAAGAVVTGLQSERRSIESDARLSIPLSPEELEKIRMPVVGEGGLQHLMRALQRQIGPDGRLSVTPVQIERILRYTQMYGSGGFQGRLQGVLVELKRLGASLSSLR